MSLVVIMGKFSPTVLCRDYSTSGSGPARVRNHHTSLTTKGCAGTQLVQVAEERECAQFSITRMGAMRSAGCVNNTVGVNKRDFGLHTTWLKKRGHVTRGSS